MNIDINLLRSFLAVAENGNLTKAAERVGRTQSAVSQQVAKLEHFLGCRLFVRHKKQVALTTQGEMFLQYAQKVLTLHYDMLDRFQDPDLTGEIKFGMPEDFAHFFLSDVLKVFRKLHPRILIRVECDLSINLLEKFRNKALDLVLLKMRVSEEGASSTEVWSEKLEWVGQNQALAENSIPLVMSPKPCVYRQSAIQALDKSHTHWNLAFSSHSYASVLEAVRAGLGITILPKRMIPKGLKVVKDKKLPPLEDAHISLLKHAHTSEAIRCFESFIVEKFNR